jgi:hypothetical protein
MNTLSKDQISWASVTGVPINLIIHKLVIDYATGDLPEAEYAAIYNMLADFAKRMADDLILQTDREINAQQAAERLSRVSR